MNLDLTARGPLAWETVQGSEVSGRENLVEDGYQFTLDAGYPLGSQIDFSQRGIRSLLARMGKGSKVLLQIGKNGGWVEAVRSRKPARLTAFDNEKAVDFQGDGEPVLVKTDLFSKLEGMKRDNQKMDLIALEVPDRFSGRHGRFQVEKNLERLLKDVLDCLAAGGALLLRYCGTAVSSGIFCEQTHAVLQHSGRNFRQHLFPEQESDFPLFDPEPLFRPATGLFYRFDTDRQA